MASPLSFPSKTASISAAADKLLASKAKLDWKPVDVDTLPAEYRALYDTMREAQAALTAARTEFEDAICGPLATMLAAKPGQDVAFTSRFGLAVALTDKREARPGALRF